MITNVRERLAFRPEKLNKVNLFDVPELFLDLYCLEPGQEQKPHVHEGAAKVYYVLEGEGTFTVGEEVRRLGPEHAVLAPSGEPHGVRSDSGSRLVLLVVMAPNPSAVGG